MTYLNKRIISILVERGYECLVILEGVRQPKWIEKVLILKRRN